MTADTFFWSSGDHVLETERFVGLDWVFFGKGRAVSKHEHDSITGGEDSLDFLWLLLACDDLVSS